jgi:hypothetical protein
MPVWSYCTHGIGTATKGTEQCVCVREVRQIERELMLALCWLYVGFTLAYCRHLLLLGPISYLLGQPLHVGMKTFIDRLWTKLGTYITLTHTAHTPRSHATIIHHTPYTIPTRSYTTLVHTTLSYAPRYTLLPLVACSAPIRQWQPHSKRI